MQTTIDIHEPLLERAKQFAAGQGKNLADVVNDALSEKLSREELPVSTGKPFRMLTFGQGGAQPDVDLNSNAGIQDALDEECRDPVTGELNLDKLR